MSLFGHRKQIDLLTILKFLLFRTSLIRRSYLFAQQPLSLRIDLRSQHVMSLRFVDQYRYYIADFSSHDHLLCPLTLSQQCTHLQLIIDLTPDRNQ